MGALQRPGAARVVLVDDEEHTVHVLTSWLGSLGYEAHGFTSAQAAVDFVAREGADLVIAGSHVADMGGSRMITALRDAGHPRPPRLLAMTPAGSSPSELDPAFDGAVQRHCALGTLLGEISRLLPPPS
jgi:CheY-like chemotaxis protein